MGVELLHRLLLGLSGVAPLLVPLLARADDAPEVLDSLPRRKLLTLIRKHPGIALIEIRRRLRLGGASLDLHVAALLNAGLVEAVRIGRFVCIYPAGHAPPPGDPMLVPESSRRIARLIFRRPQSAVELAVSLGMTERAVQVHLAALLDAGLITRRVLGRHRDYVPTDALASAIDAWKGR